MANYICPMHPDVTSDHPANCSKCGMRMEPRDEKPTTSRTGKQQPTRER